MIVRHGESAAAHHAARRAQLADQRGAQQEIPRRRETVDAEQEQLRNRLAAVALAASPPAPPAPAGSPPPPSIASASASPSRPPPPTRRPRRRPSRPASASSAPTCSAAPGFAALFFVSTEVAVGLIGDPARRGRNLALYGVAFSLGFSSGAASWPFLDPLGEWTPFLVVTALLPVAAVRLGYSNDVVGWLFVLVVGSGLVTHIPVGIAADRLGPMPLTRSAAALGLVGVSLPLLHTDTTTVVPCCVFAGIGVGRSLERWSGANRVVVVVVVVVVVGRSAWSNVPCRRPSDPCSWPSRPPPRRLRPMSYRAPFTLPRLASAAALLLLLLACGPSSSSSPDVDEDVAEDGETFVCNSPPGEEFADDRFYHPWAVLPSAEVPVPRGWQLRRGIIHIHSPYSHDACDDEGFVDGVRNEDCFDQLRQALCDTGQDFAFLTDHAGIFADYEYPDVLLYAPGDTLIERGGLPVANRIACADGREVVVASGTETGTMPIGLEHHVGNTPAERHAAYDDATPAGVEALKAAGAVALVQHTEEWAVEELLGLPLDGFEIYNLHFNLMDELGTAVNLLIDLQRRPCRVPVPELALLPLWVENDADMLRWSRTLTVRRSVGVLATDVHRNTFNGTSPDGERLDSFRRLTHWFSNYVLLPAGAVDDLALKEAVRHGRLYGGFDYLGYPIGFDFHAEGAGTFYELGDEVPAGESVVLRVVAPTVDRLDPDGPQPAIAARILRSDDGTWTEVAAGEGTVELAAAPAGVYRAEVHIVPEHLRPWLGNRADSFVTDRVWVYSNPIYVGVAWP